jgi:uncharacterized protein YcbX
MRLSEINIYPVKSLGGISLDYSVIEERGLQFDRRWLLIDEKNHFLTQREYPQMAMMRIDLGNESFNITFKQSKLTIPFQVNTEESANVKIWSSRVKAKYYADEVNNWFTERLQAKCRLVFMPEESKRIVEPFYAVRKFKDTVSFADAYPFLLIGENSLADLNEKLEKPVPMNCFRPNFVVSGAKAFEEDSWKKIKIGDTIFHGVKPCARCVMTTIDQKTAEKHGKEPLATLAKYRNKNGKVMFGRYLIAEKAGEIVKVGDKVEILEIAKSARAS